jgi:DivIVA domain-containing protein
MLGFLLFVLGVLVVAALLFLGASLLLGRGETQPPAELDRSPVELPDDRPVTSDDVRALQISAAFRGYRMSEVDWLLDQFALVLDERDAEIADLRQQRGPRPHGPHQPDPQPRGPQSDDMRPDEPHPDVDGGSKRLQAPGVPEADPDTAEEERPHA